jgi:hypothetical protein
MGEGPYHNLHAFLTTIWNRSDDLLYGPLSSQEQQATEEYTLEDRMLRVGQPSRAFKGYDESLVKLIAYHAELLVKGLHYTVRKKADSDWLEQNRSAKQGEVVGGEAIQEDPGKFPAPRPKRRMEFRQ